MDNEKQNLNLSYFKTLESKKINKMDLSFEQPH